MNKVDKFLIEAESQRIAIAKACGWFHPVGLKDSLEWWTKGDNKLTRWIPDYLNDLNAMHEAEKVLTIPQREVYWLTLCRDIVPLSGNAWHATASQRAEAFLRTLSGRTTSETHKIA